jgi:gamma-glutamylcyclotransferase (GGCT)/AIG2-like uncharacterized protein YtfP
MAATARIPDGKWAWLYKRVPRLANEETIREGHLSRFVLFKVDGIVSLTTSRLIWSPYALSPIRQLTIDRSEVREVNETTLNSLDRLRRFRAFDIRATDQEYRFGTLVGFGRNPPSYFVDWIEAIREWANI